ncbi:unnamed protein product [Moneuplotes crassus]|uniref:Uncharacterized protein n=1 Tax=Euplotes crassus TaxID=5936 RepID=A0AAD1UKE6_EUPCR|nr:unnamed protein product [Moneuplotes crassus]
MEHKNEADLRESMGFHFRNKDMIINGLVSRAEEEEKHHKKVKLYKHTYLFRKRTTRLHENDIVKWAKSRASKHTALRYLTSMDEYKRFGQIKRLFVNTQKMEDSLKGTDYQKNKQERILKNRQKRLDQALKQKSERMSIMAEGKTPNINDLAHVLVSKRKGSFDFGNINSSIKVKKRRKFSNISVDDAKLNTNSNLRSQFNNQQHFVNYKKPQRLHEPKKFGKELYHTRNGIKMNVKQSIYSSFDDAIPLKNNQSLLKAPHDPKTLSMNFRKSLKTHLKPPQEIIKHQPFTKPGPKFAKNKPKRPKNASKIEYSPIICPEPTDFSQNCPILDSIFSKIYTSFTPSYNPSKVSKEEKKKYAPQSFTF